MTLGLTFDTGALIALERRGARMGKVLYEARERRMRITVPTPVLAEWWRGTSRRRDDIRECFEVEPLAENVAKLAGEALASLARATVVDAIVMASASLRGDVVYTSDVDDLMALQAFFPSVRVLHT
jgi:predicted nucleic acid-binding protein